MAKRLGEKIGWIGGWAGGFLWVVLVSVMWMIQGRFIAGLTGFLLAALAMVLIIATAPWRHPTVQYWKLMSPLYIVMAVSCLWVIWAFGGTTNLGELWQLAWGLLPLLFPLVVLARRRWSDSES